jgi:ribose transport system ATP-binding protein
MMGIGKSFGATRALDRAELQLAPGEVHAVVGENGAGKSTLMKILSGALRPDAGMMMLDGRKYAPRDPAEARRRGVGMIYQELSLAPHMSVAENIMLGIEPRIGPLLRRRRMRALARAALARLGRTDISPAARVSTLSPAEQQLVEIARSVALGCRVLVLDEPTSSLGAEDVRRLFNLIRTLKAGGASVLYISHFLEEITEISDRFTVLRDGRTVGNGDSRTTKVQAIVSLMVGREVRELYPRSPRTPTAPMLELTDFSGPRLPRSAALELRRGEVLGIAGIIGAGRTELLRAVFGLDPVRRGTVRVAGIVGPASPARRWASRVGLVSEDRKREGLAINLTVADNLTLARQRNLGPLGLITRRGQSRACAPWIARLPIKCLSAHQRIGDLSGGNQQKVALARLLHADAEVLLLDEPTRGIDVGSKAEIYRLIDQLAVGDAAAGRAPKAILMVSSYLPELIGVCDRIAVMCRGVLGPARQTSEIDEHQIMTEATGAI